MTFHAEVMTGPQRQALSQLAAAEPLQNMYLGGGTAVAVQLGHRTSVDLDWFTEQPLRDPAALAGEIAQAAVPFATSSVARGTLHGLVAGVRISFFETRYPLLRPVLFWPEFGCRLASAEDLGAMKLLAVAQRGARKDFLDVYALGLSAVPLREMLSLFRQKYRVDDVSRVLYGLSYFEDAEAEPMPQVLVDLDWNEVKATIKQWVKDLA